MGAAHGRLPGRVAGTAVALSVLASCGSNASCAHVVKVAKTCPDLSFRGSSYAEWRAVDPPEFRQELGDGSYPACTTEGGCNDLGGFGSTDVWLLRGVDPGRAVLGLRQGTRTYVVFVRLGVDPDTVRPLLDPDLLR